MTAVHDFALEATRRYLQSVVFVDDEIYYDLPAKAVEVSVGSAKTMTVFAKPVAPKVEEVIEGATPAEAAAIAEKATEIYHPKKLVESFARARMVCALYEPEPNFPTDQDSEIFRLCERADAVILDWEFDKEPGKKILPLLAGLVSAAQTTVPHHVRLCAIYTSTPDLKKVAGQIFEHLKNEGLEVEPDGEYNLDAGSSRIIVLGKPSTGRPQDQIEAAQVSELDLADRIIEEFASKHEGILPALALNGLAGVRTNAKKILDKFRADLDGAFLVQRGLILPDDDAFEQIPELLAEEALAVMMDNQPASAALTTLADEAIAARCIKTKWAAKGDVQPADGALAVQLLRDGPRGVEKRTDLNADALRALHDDLDPQKTAARERLAALYTTRTPYAGSRPLTFGTIVRHEAENGSKHYAICLMPLCDCVRLKKDKPYRFPFWELRPSNSGAASKGTRA